MKLEEVLLVFRSDLSSYLTPRAKQMMKGVLLLFVVGSLLVWAVPTPDPDHAWEDKGDDAFVLHLFELGGLVGIGLALFHASRHWPREEVIIFFASCFTYALFFEDMNIQLSEDYAYNKEAWLVVHNTMLVIALGWCIIAYCLVFTINTNPVLKSWNPVEKGILAGLLGLTIDLGIDATAFAYGLWYWEGGVFFGVPLTNFVGWFAALFTFVFSSEYLKEKGRNWPFEKRLKARLFAIFPDYGGLLVMVGFGFAFLALLGLK